jgi:peptidyl-prolyl cis-trans isomerase D
MLRQLRESMKTVLWIVVAAFVISIFAVWGMDLRTPQRRTRDRNVIGSVDKELITQQEYQNVLNTVLAQLKQQKGENYTPSDMERRLIEDQAWELTIQGILMKREMDKLNITVTDQELVTFLRQNPHPSLQEVFKTQDGKFDYQAYLRALSDPNVDWSELERWGRSILPELKLQTYLFAQVNISNEEALENFKEQNVRYKAQYVEVPYPKTNPPYEPTDAEIKALYDKRMNDFKEPPMRRVRVIEIERKPSAADEREAEDRLIAIRDEIVKGQTDFATAAKDNSDDESTAEKGGDLGLFKRGDMVAAFDSVAFSLKPGQISMPVRTPYGYHIIQVEERKKEGGVEKIHARHILIKVEPGYETTDSLSTAVRNVAEAIHKDGFEKAAADLKLKTFETDPFPQGMFIKNIGYVPRIVSFAFSYKTGDVSTAIESDAAYYFVKIIQEIPERVKPIDEVKQQLIAEIRSNRDAEAARATAESIRRDILTGGSFSAAARTHGLVAKETPLFALHDAIPDIGTNTPFSVACRFLAVDEVSPPIVGQGRCYIIKLLEKTQPDLAKFAEERATIVEDLRKEASSRFVANWYQGIREKAHVVDLRERTLD